MLYPLSYEGGERSRSWSRNTAPEHGTSLIMVENGLHTSGEGLKAPENALSPPLGVREPGYRAGEDRKVRRPGSCSLSSADGSTGSQQYSPSR